MLLVATLLLAGCMDTLFPQREEVEEAPDDGTLRVWAAARPGAIGGEFVHYNITFGRVWHARDLLLEDLYLMEPRTTTVDLVRLEQERKAVEIARATVPDGEYSGFGFAIGHASVAVERVVGNQDGVAVTRIEETPIDFSTTVITPRANHVVFGGKVTDLYIEIDLQRSLQRGDGGTLRHGTVPAGITIAVDGTRVDWHPMDGGASRLPPSADDDEEDTKKKVPPSPALEIKDAETGTRHYFDRLQPNKRMNRAVGLGEDLVFDASRSVSNILLVNNLEGTVEELPIVEHHWDFADGTTATGSRVTKNFTKGGLFDVTLTVRDANDNIARDHVTLFVPYQADQAVARRSQSGEGTLLLGTPEADPAEDVNTRLHRFTFDEELENGTLRLGGYQIRLVTEDPLGGQLLGLQSVRMVTRSGHFERDETRPGIHDVKTGGIPIWRGPLKPWVDHEIEVTVQLVNGAMAEYTLDVEAHYTYNLSRGLDPHGGHLHASWPFGPRWDHLEWDGAVDREEEE